MADGTNQNLPITNTPPPQQVAVSSNPTPEHEPLAFHFSNHSESLNQVDQQEISKPPENLPSPLANNQPYTPPILEPNQTFKSQSYNPLPNPFIAHPPLPLSDDEIVLQSKSKQLDNSVHWLALWCIRQLEIYEKSLDTK